MVAIDDKWIGTVQDLKIDIDFQPRVTITFAVDSVESLPVFNGGAEEWIKTQ